MIRLGDEAAGASPILWVHPAVHSGHMFASDFGGGFDANFGNDSFGWVQMLVTHTSIFAIIAILSQAKFAIFAIETFAPFANMTE